MAAMLELSEREERAVLGRRIRERREQLRIPRRVVHERLGFGTRTIQEIEQGRGSRATTQLLAIALGLVEPPDLTTEGSDPR